MPFFVLNIKNKKNWYYPTVTAGFEDTEYIFKYPKNATKKSGNCEFKPQP